jgi:hypothetical protein
MDPRDKPVPVKCIAESMRSVFVKKIIIDNYASGIHSSLLLKVY